MSQNSTTQLLHTDIYPALFHVLPQALPEFEFIRTQAGYRSTNTRKISGEEDGDGKGKVYVYEDSPGYLKDYRGGRISIWDYVQQQQGLNESSSVLRRIAQLAEYALPEQAYSPDQVEHFKRLQRISDAWESANAFFIDCLSKDDNVFANMPGAARVRDYLTRPLSEGGRGYSPALFRLSGQAIDRETPRMELGFIPSLPDLTYHLQDAGFAANEINELTTRIGKAGPAVGRENILTFPYRDHTGRIQGMTFRTVDQGGQSKYLYSEFKRSEILFNLRSVAGDRDLVIVESPLDSMHAAALGVKNITALGGSGNSISRKQIDLAVRYGAKKITLMLDNDSEDGVDRAGVKGTDAAVTFLQREYPDLRVFVASYPEGIKDLDELLSTDGVEDGYKPAIDNAAPAWNYQLDRIFARYATQAGDNDLTHKQVEALLDEVLQTAAKLPVLDKDIFINVFISDPGVQGLGITQQSLQDTIDKIRKADFEREKQSQLQNLLKDAAEANKAGRTNEVLDLLTQRTQAISLKDKADVFKGLTSTIALSDLVARMKQKPVDLLTGITFGEGDEREEVRLGAGAISIIAAPTNHGKTTMLVNMALKACKDLPKEKNVYVLTLEESADPILIRALNLYVGEELSASNIRTINSYLRGHDTYFGKNKHKFEAGLIRFFDELINPGKLNIQYVEYDSNTLNDAVYHLHKFGNAGAIFIDYIQLLRISGDRFNNRADELARICNNLKDAAVKTNIPIVLAAQFNRRVTNPLMMHPTNISDGSDIEKSAAVILAMWNNNKKLIIGENDKKTLESTKNYYEARDTVYLELLKNRYGKTDDCSGMFDYNGNIGSIRGQKQLSNDF
jgi:DNA primase